MKKDKEWLKKEIEEYLEYEGVRDARIALESVLGYINQLDEPETLSQEWIDDHKVARINNLRKMTTSDVVTVEKLKNLLVPKQDEPEQTDINVGLLKPTIPQFVADYIEKWKYEGLIMHEWFTFDHDDEDEDKVFKWLYNNDYEENTTREDLLIDAIRHGYEVEREPQWVVKDDTGYLSYLQFSIPNIYERETSLDKNDAYKFNSKSKADLIADLVTGTVEEVTE